MSTNFTPGPWEWWTSNSLKRLSSGDKDGSVLYAYRCSDGAPDVAISEADMALIAAAPTMADYIKRHAEAGDAEAIAIWEAINGRA